MQITFDLTNAEHLRVVQRIVGALAAPAAPLGLPVVTAELPESASAAVAVLATANAKPDPVVIVAEDAPVKRGPGRPRKAKIAAPEGTLAAAVDSAREAEEVETPPAEPAKPLTVDDVRAALQGFTAAHGVPAGLALLKTFGASRISELKAEDYPAFVKGCAA